MAVTVRKATYDDIGWIVNELESFSDFFDSKLKLFPGEEHTAQVIKLHIDDHIILVSEKDGELSGFISGMIGKHFFNPSMMTVTETFWWVAEKFRQSRSGLMLLNEFTRIAKEKSHWIVFTLEKNSPINDRCLTSRGFKAVETQYLMENI